MEIVEHVDNVNIFINQSSELLKKNGIMFIATLNKTLKSYIFAIIGAEYILRWLPIGTHDWNKFFKPEEINNKLEKLNLKRIDLTGLNYGLINREWKTSSDCSVNYIMASIKT